MILPGGKMTDRNMLPIQSILNQSSPSRPRTPYSRRSGSQVSSPASDLNEAMTPPADGRLPTARHKKTSDLTYSETPPGPIKYPPYEDLDPDLQDLVLAFDVFPFGYIKQLCAHISYSSDKKDVFEKTGRESFHVFVYKFTDPSDRQSYEVMWDYVGGFVRISPFFKSRKHKKTGPAKMLDLNNGLRDVTFHMTGGNRIAQGYWVPYHCARAVCATFCHPIAGALIPIFGPSFLQDCIPPESPLFGRMVIDERIVIDAKHEIAAYRHASLTLYPRQAAVTSHPRHGPHLSDVTRHGNTTITGFDHHQPHGYDNRGDLAMNNYYNNSYHPIQSMPWRPSTAGEAYGMSSSQTSPWNPANLAMRHDPMRAIDPHLRSESQDYPPLHGPPSSSTYNKRNLPGEDQLRPIHHYGDSSSQHKRMRLQYPDGNSFHNSPPHGASSYVAPDGPLPKTVPSMALTEVPFTYRQANETKHTTANTNNKKQPKPKTAMSKEKESSAYYTIEEVQAATALVRFHQPAQEAKEQSKQHQKRSKRAISV